MEPVKTRKKRLLHIDALKGLAILCVVLGHIGNGYMWDDNADQAFFAVYNITNAFHMPLFILLSGVVFQKAYCGRREEPLQRGRIAGQLLNLTILYFLWSILLGVFKIAFGGFVNNPVNWVSLALIPVKPIQLYWYLFVLIIFYVIFGVIGAAKWNPFAVLAAALGLNLLSALLPADMLFDLKRVFFFALFFFLGITLTFLEELAVKTGRETLFLFIPAVFFAAAIVLFIVFWDRDVFLHDRFIVNTVIGTGISLGLYYSFKRIRFLGENRFLVWIGKHSLEIYLLHTFILTAVRVLFGRIGIQNTVFLILSGLCLGVFLPLLIALIFRKIRIYDLFFSPFVFFRRLISKNRQKAD